MLHVLLLLLKILGILLLLLIGLFLLVLFTPIRYSFELEKEEQTEPKFAVRVTWLFWIFYFKTSYIEKVFDYRVRILGHQIAGNQPEFLKKQKERQRRKAEKEKARREREKNKEEKDRKKTVEEKSERTTKTKKPEETAGNLPVTVTEKKASIQKKVPEEDILQSDLPADTVADIPEESQNQNTNSVIEQENKNIVPKEKSSETSKGKEKADDEIKVKEKDAEAKEQKKDNKGTKESDEKKDKKPKKESSLKKIKGKIKSLKEAKANLDKLPWREWLELGKDILIRFLKHVLPRKLEGSIAFGTGDPEYTGYITGIAAIFYPKYGEHFSLYPDFERKMFEAKCKGRGRIRPGYMLVLVVSILKEKSVRTMIKNIILG